MVERCLMCGARWRDNAIKCHDCGAPRTHTDRPSTSNPIVGQPSTATPTVLSAEAASPTGSTPRRDGPPSEPNQRRGRLALIVGLPLILGGIVASLVFFADDANRDPSVSIRGIDPPDCDDLQALAGSWSFTTVTTNARKKSRIGMRGFFDIAIDVNDCSATAVLTKVGHKSQPWFGPQRRPQATAALHPGEGLYAFGHGAQFDLLSEGGHGVPLQMTFAREGDQLVGAWRQIEDRWMSSGMYGILLGEQKGSSDPRKLQVRVREQPCIIQCAAPEDIAAVDHPTDACRLSCQ